MGNNLMLVLGGMVTIVVGATLAGITIDTAATTGANTNIGSFSGAKSFNDLLPLVFYIGLIVVGLGAMGIGAIRSIRG